jgi:AAA+ superfamily predicted ATPase
MPKVEILVDNKIKCGFQDENENWIIKPLYQDIFEITTLADLCYQVKYNNYWGIIFDESNWIVKPIYENITFVDEYASLYLLVTINGKVGVIDYCGKYLIEPKYDSIENVDMFYDMDTYIVQLDNKMGIISSEDNLQVEPIYDLIIPDPKGDLGGSCKAKINDTWGRIQRDGKFIDENQFQQECEKFSQILFNYQLARVLQNQNLFFKLKKLTGLTEVKKELLDIYSYVKNQKKRIENGLKTRPLSYHMVFYGPPGTGKTTVARIVGEMFKELGILKKGHFIEADRSQLVGEYLGQTAPKVNQIVDRALDGILFIDEAYSLFSKQEDIFAKEAVNTLIKRIEDDRDRLIVIMAGYKEQMESFIESNPGFKSRFNMHLNFNNYSKEELLEIFKQICIENDYTISQLVEDAVLKIIENELSKNEKAFSNARYVRNLFETITKKQARRLGSISFPSKDELQSIEIEDLS